MLYFAQKLLNTELVKDFRKRLLLCPEWIEGSNSAQGKDVNSGKKNLQLKTGKSYELLSQEMINILMGNEQIKRIREFDVDSFERWRQIHLLKQNPEK